MTCGIYQILCISSGKRYIGKSKNVERRWQVHKRLLKKGNHWNPKLQNSWNKYGEKNFQFSILEEILNDILKEREQWYFDNLNEELLNISRESQGGWDHVNSSITPEIRKSHSERLKKILTPEKRKEVSMLGGRARWDKIPQEKRKEELHRSMKITPDNLFEICRKAGRIGGKKRAASITHEERMEWAKRAWGKKTSEEKKDMMKDIRSYLTSEQIRENMRKGRESLTQEKRSKNAKKGWMTRRKLSS